MGIRGRLFQAITLARMSKLLTEDVPATEATVECPHCKNVLAGKDDAAILKELWQELEDVSLKYYSGLDDKALGELLDSTLNSLSEAKIDYQHITVLFLPEEVERFEKAFAKAKDFLATDSAFVARLREFSELVSALDKVKSSFRVVNSATAFALLLDIFEGHQEELSAGWLGPTGEAKHKGRVPLSSVFGTDKIPAALAADFKRALDKALASKQIESLNSWKLLELLLYHWAPELKPKSNDGS